MSKAKEYFQCQGCGKCCEKLGLPYEPSKFQEIADFLNISVKDLVESYYGKYTENGGEIKLDDNKRIPCPFLTKEVNGNTTCRIYPVRPTDCISFPINPLRYDFMECPSVEFIFNKFKSEEI